MIPFTQKSCMGCTDRTVGCHSTCERYKQDKEIHEDIVKRAGEDREADSYTMAYVCKYRNANTLRKKRHVVYRRNYK